jgi:transposase InsO family protein
VGEFTLPRKRDNPPIPEQEVSMFNERELQLWFDQCQLSLEARKLIEEVRSAPPSRRLDSTIKSVFVQYASRKMGCVIQARGHRLTLPAVIQMEYDDAVLEFYDQPPPFPIRYLTKASHETTPLARPDFFVMGQDSAGWTEWRSEKDLVQRARKMPNRYVRTADGQWRCPPGEAYAGQFGLFYQVHSTVEINWIFQRNINFLSDYLQANCPQVNRAVIQPVLSQVAAEPGITLHDLQHAVAAATPDDLHILIAQQQVYVDLGAEPLAKPMAVRVFANKETAQAYALALSTADEKRPDAPSVINMLPGETFVWDERLWQILNVGKNEVALLGEENELISLPQQQVERLLQQGCIHGVGMKPKESLGAEVKEALHRASPADLREANHRYHLLFPTVSDLSTPSRTKCRWRKRWNEAESRYGYGYVGLIPHTSRRGNRQRKLPMETITLMDEYVQKEYETIKCKSIQVVYDQLRAACGKRGIVPPSYKTFCQAVQARPSYEQTRKRRGAKAAYDHEPFYLILELTTPRHGDRPFEIGHLDHTQLDIELVDSEIGKPLGRPWLILLIDAYSRRILALALIFDPPSYRTCLLLLRECVRLYGRLPQTIIVDNGPEFKSAYFETFLALYGITKKTRPKSKSRFGGVVERLFGTANQTFIHNLTGNTQNTRQRRELTPSILPKKHAIWTLRSLYTRLCEWGYEIYDQETHTMLGQAPRDAFVQGLAQSGHRLHKRIAYDQAFIMTALPTTTKGTAQVRPNKGVKLNYLYYWTEAFRDRQLENQTVPVRYDPFNAGIAYAFVHGRWQVCVSEHYAFFRGRSEREIKLATSELRCQQQRDRKSISSRRLIEFLSRIELEEIILKQQLLDREMQSLISHKPIDKVEPSPQASESMSIPGQTAWPSPETANDAVAPPIFEDF